MDLNSADRDLYWFFNNAQASIGVQSNFNSVYNAIMSGGASRSSLPDSMTESRIDASTRYGEILTRLNAMPQSLRDVIYAAYQPRKYPPSLTAFLGERLVPVTPFCKSANEFFEADAARTQVDDHEWFAWLEGVSARGEYERMGTMKGEARALLDKALDSY